MLLMHNSVKLLFVVNEWSECENIVMVLSPLSKEGETYIGGGR